MKPHLSRRRFGASAAAIAIALSTMLVAAPSVLATGPIGICRNLGVASNHQGESVVGNYYAISASVDVPGSTLFGPCKPNDLHGINASAVAINSHYLNAWVEGGIIICNNTDNGAWPSTLCNGGRHWFFEQHGQAIWDYNMVDLGAADTAIHTIELRYYVPLASYRFSVDGVVRFTMNMGSGLSPTLGPGFEWQMETQDNGDGLGSNFAGGSTDIGQMKVQTGGSTWINHAVGAACDGTDSELHCVPNGTYGFYGYTTN